MKSRVKKTKIGNSAGITLPNVVTTQRDFETQTAVAREVMARRKLALRELAK